MIYFCADDYGLCDESSKHIKDCIDAGALNKVSVFPNFDSVDLQTLRNSNQNIRISLHLNLVEGKCLSSPEEISLIADRNGNLIHTFEGLFKLNIFKKKQFEEQAYKEVRAQIRHWKKSLPDDIPFCIDTHQHTSMIPGVFKAILRALTDEKISPQHMRIPIEPLSPFITTPSLYFTYSAINVIKQWLLNLLWLLNKKEAIEHNIKSSYFLGILFSGKMDEKRVRKILPKYINLAKKDDSDIEVLFHPGYLTKASNDFKRKNVVFDHFYLSNNRKTEFDSLLKLTERSAS